MRLIGGRQHALQQSRVEAAYDLRRLLAGLTKDAVDSHEDAVRPEHVVAAKRGQRSQSLTRIRCSTSRTDETAEAPPCLQGGGAPGAAQLFQRPGEQTRELPVQARGMSEFDWTPGQAVELGWFAPGTWPATGGQVSKSDQPLEMLKGDRSVYAGHCSDFVNGSLARLVVKAEEDRPAGGITEGGQGLLHGRPAAASLVHVVNLAYCCKKSEI